MRYKISGKCAIILGFWKRLVEFYGIGGMRKFLPGNAVFTER